jgi:cysteine desulfurase
MEMHSNLFTKIRSEIHKDLKQSRAYLDWASAAPVHSRIQEAAEHALKSGELWGNPSSPHAEGRAAKEELERARISTARLAGVKPRGVIFTSGATEANNLAIRGRVGKMRAVATAAGKELSKRDVHLLYLPTMHASVLETIQALAAEGIQTEPIPLLNGAIHEAQFSALLRPETVLVCVDAVCGETGIRYDTLRLRRVIDAASLSETALLMVDASQLPLVEPIEHTRLGADLITLDAQKVGALRGVGALISARPNRIAPITYGGGQEGGLRPGTEPVALISLFAEALELRASGWKEFSKQAQAERAHLIAEITHRIPAAFINDGEHQAPHILNLSLPGIDTDYAVTLLDTDGFAVSTKSACETDSGQGSKAVLALTNDPDRAASTLRISWGPETPAEALKAFPAALERVYTFLAQ